MFIGEYLGFFASHIFTFKVPTLLSKKDENKKEDF